MPRKNKPHTRKQVCQPGQVPLSAQTVAQVASLLRITRDRLVSASHVTASRPDSADFSEDFRRGWEAAMSVVQKTLSGELTVTPKAEPETLPLFPEEPNDDTINHGPIGRPGPTGPTGPEGTDGDCTAGGDSSGADPVPAN